MIDFQGLFVSNQNISTLHLFSSVFKLGNCGDLDIFMMLFINACEYNCEDSEGSFVSLSLASFISYFNAGAKCSCHLGAAPL